MVRGDGIVRAVAWDTSARTCSLAAMEWNPSSKEPGQGLKLVSEWNLNNELAHSERLLWAIHRILEAARWKLSDVTLIGVGVGPGSFTGLRIGVTTARTLGQALNLPVLGFSSLIALARAAGQGLATSKTTQNTLVISATDACKGELFASVGPASALTECVCRADGDVPGVWKRGVEEGVYTHEELLALIGKKLKDKKSATAPWVVVGEARDRYPDLWASLPAKRRLPMGDAFGNQMQGRVIAKMVWEGFQMGLARPALDVKPRYLRVSAAEKKREKDLSS